VIDYAGRDPGSRRGQSSLGRLGAGIAAVETPASCIQCKGKDIDIPTAVGQLTQFVWDELTGIQTGKLKGRLDGLCSCDKIQHITDGRQNAVKRPSRDTVGVSSTCRRSTATMQAYEKLAT
jgi:hypothetical protein